ncbi:MAG: bifunctional UDP-N-acetylmuramoyl-tripeptide:D-alanyl-D-alanine ligase/alanine racemase [Bacteroidia bacterium]|nr:bifunctional UDP-N-acetylmuramoyl-tripeptide:D-alanyl-D-alanine ligase/alanine racemase [Bacteroidia bacterium]
MLGLPYHIQEIAQAGVANDLFQGIWPAPSLRYISFDTRTIAHGAATIFIALSTDHRDGHAFVEAAYAKGVRHFITRKPLPWRDVNWVLAEDPLAFLQRWAYHHRLRFHYPVVAITGSNGKTTVKEWASTLMEQDARIVKSPMSYNSQLGVAISLLHLHPQADLALIEAGVGKIGDMASLAAMIQPDLGVLTHMGAAHADGFDSEAQKLEEKLQLFEEAETILTTSFQPHIQAQYSQLPWSAIGKGQGDAIRLVEEKELDGEWKITLSEQEEIVALSIPLTGKANLENALLAILIARKFGVSYATISDRIRFIRPVEMRTEIITDHPLITIINDAYNSDIDSIRNAFQQIKNYQLRSRRIIVLSDIVHQGAAQLSLQQEILEEAIDAVGKDNLFLVGPVFASLTSHHSFETVEDLQAAIDVDEWTNSTVLLKGARSFALERLIPWLQRKPNATFFKIDLALLSHNYRFLKTLVPDHTKIMGMVKASSYGGGTWEIAQKLVEEGVDYLAVAYPSEGIELREAGINIPIMVMNADPDSVAELIRYDLEPEVGHFRLLDRYVQAALLADATAMNIHLKLETGMGRLGFQEGQLPELMERLQRHPDLRVVSIMTHLAAADTPAESGFSRQQVSRFQQMADQLKEAMGLEPLRHVLNTAGVLHFPEFCFDMVRLGLGLYGIDPTPDNAAKGQLQEIGSLHAFITQIADHPAGVSIGYGRSQTTERPTRIATVPIGYADGILRNLGNGKISFLVNGKPAPTFGRICMDMLMLDVTDIPEANAGDEVVLFGRQGEEMISVSKLAEAAGTIPYEILVRISPRVRRIFEKE